MEPHGQGRARSEGVPPWHAIWLSEAATHACLEAGPLSGAHRTPLDRAWCVELNDTRDRGPVLALAAPCSGDDGPWVRISALWNSGHAATDEEPLLTSLAFTLKGEPHEAFGALRLTDEAPSARLLLDASAGKIHKERLMTEGLETIIRRAGNAAMNRRGPAPPETAGYELAPDLSVADDLASIARTEEYVASSAKALLGQATLLTPKKKG